MRILILSGRTEASWLEAHEAYRDNYFTRIHEAFSELDGKSPEDYAYELYEAIQGGDLFDNGHSEWGIQPAVLLSASGFGMVSGVGYASQQYE